jgi:hypothetical protein
MIIFNLWAIPVVLVIYLIITGLHRFFPSLMAEPHGSWAAGIVIVLVSGICDLIGVKGRLFLLPIWVLGLGFLCYLMGWQGSVGFVIFLIVAAIWFFKSAKKKEIVDWQKAQEEALRTSVSPVNQNEVQFWTWVKATLFLPCWMKYTPDLSQHNMRVIQAIQKSTVSLSQEEATRFAAFGQFLTQAQSASKPPETDVKVRDAIEALVKRKLRQAEINAGKTKVAAPPVILAGKS